jgi:organic hydroperoxide reductase OsmC/OhrA
MPGKSHHYPVTVTWTGNTGSGTARVNAYSKDHEVAVDGKSVIPAASDPSFGGDPARWNPEELLVASLSQCHMLWFLSRCARHHIVVTAYVDNTEGTMTEDASGGGRFDLVVLRPEITLADENDQERADALHHEAHELCFIASSVNFPVTVEAVYRTERDR